LMKMEPPFRL